MGKMDRAVRSFRMEGAVHSQKTQERLRVGAAVPMEAVYRSLGTGLAGLTEEQARVNRESYGANEAYAVPYVSVKEEGKAAVKEPLAVILFILFLICLAADIITPLWIGSAAPLHGGTTVITAVLGGLVLMERIAAAQEARRQERIYEGLRPQTCLVVRGGEEKEIAAAELVVGDRIILRAGEILTADVRLDRAEGAAVRQEMKNGCCRIVRKAVRERQAGGDVAEMDNLVLAGSEWIAGKAEGIVLAVGAKTVYGNRVQPIAAWEADGPEAAETIGLAAAGAALGMRCKRAYCRAVAAGLTETGVLAADKVIRRQIFCAKVRDTEPITEYKGGSCTAPVWRGGSIAPAEPEEEEPPGQRNKV